MDAGEVLIDYLYSKRNSPEEKSLYNIYKVYDITIEDFKDRTTMRNRRTGSSIIEGKLLVKFLN